MEEYILPFKKKKIFKIYTQSVWWFFQYCHGVVVIDLAFHAVGPVFDPSTRYIFLIFFLLAKPPGMTPGNYSCQQMALKSFLKKKRAKK